MGGSIDLTIETTILDQATFEEEYPPWHPGYPGFVHFSDTVSTLRIPIYTQGRNYAGLQDTGMQARAYIESLAASYGWPLIGWFGGAQGGITPHMVLHVSDWPNNQVGSDREAKLGAELEKFIEDLYKVQPQPSEAFTVDPLTDILSNEAHGLQTGQEIGFLSDGDLPSPLDSNTEYLAVVINPDTFYASLDGINPLNITDAGTGTHYINYNFGIDVRGFWLSFHCFNWKSDETLYVPNVDYVWSSSQGPPSAGWWQDLQG